ncbi:IS110 family transposase [Rathayibacter soli]|uniref:IS110 family transposase n=1 Tax=Rathayibacter soli TaxID=3144168 RepID=UPI0027E4A118|nr:transposase [Glaciibacter superstes]
MTIYRSFVGLDVHVRTIVGCAIDVDTGEVLRRRFGYDLAEVVFWVASLPGPTQVTYEAGPTGFGLYRRLIESGIWCVVAAPSKLQRPSGDRVKTDQRDAFHLARLLKLDEIVAVTVPSIEEETSRDLVRTREDTRQDLMASRHRLSKLLLMHGFVDDDGEAWTRKHDRWLRQHRDGDLAFQTRWRCCVGQSADTCWWTHTRGHARYHHGMRRTNFPLPTSWDRKGLAAAGFEGFVPLVGLVMKEVTPEKGIYAVLRPNSDAPYTLLEHSPLDRYTLEDLERRWIPGAPIVYIGKAGSPTSKGGLKSRLNPFGRKARSHSGGRSIWQLDDVDQLLICWIKTPGMDPQDVERDYLDEFARVHLAQPFANVDGRK